MRLARTVTTFALAAVLSGMLAPRVAASANRTCSGSTPSEVDTYDVQSVVLNEMGHVNTLGHHVNPDYGDAVVQLDPGPLQPHLLEEPHAALRRSRRIARPLRQRLPDATVPVGTGTVNLNLAVAVALVLFGCTSAGAPRSAPLVGAQTPSPLPSPHVFSALGGTVSGEDRYRSFRQWASKYDQVAVARVVAMGPAQWNTKDGRLPPGLDFLDPVPGNGPPNPSTDPARTRACPAWRLAE
jgi:hypothetical protein